MKKKIAVTIAVANYDSLSVFDLFDAKRTPDTLKLTLKFIEIGLGNFTEL